MRDLRTARRRRAYRPVDEMRIRSIGILITSAFLISILSFSRPAQKRRGLSAPQQLLELLDQEERHCVTQNGDLNKSVSVQLMPLASGPGRQILVRGSGLCLCGAQNCSFWIFLKTANKYELLLKGIGSTNVRAGQQSSKGYRDVISESHASAMETIIRTYRYDGAQYQLQRCVSRAYYDDNGNQTKKPIFRPCQ